jgi:hypothetical protein
MVQFHSTPNNASEAEWVEFPSSNFSIAPLAFLFETLLAAEEHWEPFPSLVPLFLREALAELLEATPPRLPRDSRW